MLLVAQTDWVATNTNDIIYDRLSELLRTTGNERSYQGQTNLERSLDRNEKLVLRAIFWEKTEFRHSVQAPSLLNMSANSSIHANISRTMNFFRLL